MPYDRDGWRPFTKDEERRNEERQEHERRQSRECSNPECPWTCTGSCSRGDENEQSPDWNL